jgi:hypothetical protein
MAFIQSDGKLGGEIMESSLVYQNDSSIRVFFLSLILPLVPLYAFLVLSYLLDIGGILLPFSVVYLTLWLAFFSYVLCNVNQVMVADRENIRFINPYGEKVIPLRGIRTIYYNDKRGFNIRMMDQSEKRYGFRIDLDKPLLEETFRRLSSLLDFEEEHIQRSHVYCLVNNRIA